MARQDAGGLLPPRRERSVVVGERVVRPARLGVAQKIEGLHPGACPAMTRISCASITCDWRSTAVDAGERPMACRGRRTRRAPGHVSNTSGGGGLPGPPPPPLSTRAPWRTL